MRTLTSTAELLAATGDAPVVRYEIGTDIRAAVAHDGAVLCCRMTQGGDDDLLGLGPDDGIVALVERRRELPPPLSTAPSLTVESRSIEALRRLGLPEPDRWALLTLASPGRLSGPEVALVDLRDRLEQTRAFLDHHYTSRWTTPGRMTDELWLGHERGGRLVAAGCLSRTPGGVGLLGGITVAAEVRGRGLGRALTVELARRGLDRYGVVTLGLDEGNPVAEGLYLDLGFTVAHSWASVPLPR